MVLSGRMDDQFAPDPDRRLSSLDGLIEAGIIESFHFNPFTGFAGIAYTQNWIRILQSRMVLLIDPFFNAAILVDDPVAMRAFVEREGARLTAESASTEPPPKQGARAPRRRR
jgi:hypothetical protein